MFKIATVARKNLEVTKEYHLHQRMNANSKFQYKILGFSSFGLKPSFKLGFKAHQRKYLSPPKVHNNSTRKS